MKVYIKYLNVSDNPITNLEGCCSKNVKLHSLRADYCYELISLKGSPERVNGKFSLQSCTSLKSLEHAPKYVGSWFSVHNCRLRTLEHAPDYIGDYFEVNHNPLISLEGFPKKVDGDFYISYDMYDKFKETCEELKATKRVLGKINFI